MGAHATATRRRSASPTTPSMNWATWFTSNCRPLGKELKKGDPAANIESVKAVSDVYAPVSGTITAVNAKLGDNPELVNQEPFGEGWLFKMSIDAGLPSSKN